MSNEELIISLLKSKQSTAELFNNNLDDDKTSDIGRILNRLRNILPKNYRKEILKNLYEIENNKNLPEVEKEENDGYLRKSVRILNNKEKHHPYYRDDFDCYKIWDIESLFDKVSEEDYYKLILIKSFFKGKCKYYESRDDKETNLSVRQYLNEITQHLYDLKNDHKIARKVWKIQISMHVLLYGVLTQKLCGVVTQMILLENFLSFFT